MSTTGSVLDACAQHGLDPDRTSVSSLLSAIRPAELAARARLDADIQERLDRVNRMAAEIQARRGAA